MEKGSEEEITEKEKLSKYCPPQYELEFPSDETSYNAVQILLHFNPLRNHGKLTSCDSSTSFLTATCGHASLSPLIVQLHCSVRCVEWSTLYVKPATRYLLEMHFPSACEELCF